MGRLSKFPVVALLSVMMIAMFDLSGAQNAPADYLNPHNDARDEVGVPHMTWDNKLASYAQNHADSLTGDCALNHSDGPYGENLAKAYPDLNAADAVKLWVDEKDNYDYNSNSCVGGDCGHYTQVVWRSSVRLGCGRARCNNGWWLISCSYDPAGNVSGQRPY
ncbi:PREDICTED: basic form of pathogenesis-related protein 1-like [Ipomoea nil]|uniref:basic form of pathogenesis-related protein 1-like n=1 Tax=Ipomoea nil TaxID=35883 RepID=UPI0009012EAC|nr:PREDICTED: basic form of pathogenesis-related protein 1-like [Ipomoea nil]